MAQSISNLQPSLVLKSYITMYGPYPQDGSHNPGDAPQTQEEYLGVIRMTAANFAPGIDLDGQTLSIDQYEALFNLLGTTYGGDGQATFKLPDFSGDVAVGAGGASGLSLGQHTGTTETTLNRANLPVSLGGGALPFGNYQPSEAANYLIAINDSDGLYRAGMLMQTAFAAVPTGFLPTDGRALSATDYPALFAAIGHLYGGSGDSFRLPDLRGRAIIGDDATTEIGQAVGQATVTLTNANAPGSAGGGGQAFDNGQPALVMTYLIALNGLWPDRDGGRGADASDPYIGEIFAYAGIFDPPQGFMRAEGQVLQISNYPALYSLLGTTYGGDGKTTFQLPDLRGRVAVDDGAGRSLGETFGAQAETLDANEIPAPVAPVVTSPANGAMVTDDTPDITGTAAPNSTVSVFIDGTLSGTTKANAAGAWTYTPSVALSQSAHNIYAVASYGGDVSPNSAFNSFTVDVNDAPVLMGAQAVLAVGSEDVAFTVSAAQLLQGFRDPDGTKPVVTNVTVDHGTVASDGQGGYTITPTADYSGPVTISYRVSDGSLSTPASLTKTLGAVNDAPRLTGTQTTFAAGTEDTAFTVTAAELLQGFSDPEGNTLTLSSPSVDHGSIVADGQGGYTVTPEADYSGPVTISYQVGDGTASVAASLTKTLAAVNDAPRLTGAQTTLAASTEDTAFTVTAAELLQGFSDPEGTTPIVTNVRVDHGTVASDGQGGYTITPTADYSGPVTISYRVGDGSLSTPASLTKTLGAVNDAPVLSQPTAVTLSETAAAGTLIATLAATDVDDAGSALRYAITGGNEAGLFSIDAVTGAVTLAAGRHLDYETATSHALTVVAIDAAGLPSAARTLTVGVSNVNEATAITALASRAGPLTAGDTVTITLTTESAIGVTGAPTLSLSNGASATYAGLDDVGHATFVYTVAAGQDITDLGVSGLSLNGGSLDRSASLGFATPTSVSVGLCPINVTLADVNGDGNLDILTANLNASTVSVRLGDGAGHFTGTTEVKVGISPFSVAVADVNGDDRLDILAACNFANKVSVRLGDGAGNFSGTTEVKVGTSPGNVVVADVNGDGRLDILAASQATNKVSVRLGDGAGNFSGTTEVKVGEFPYSVTLADVNGDGRLDILTANYFSESVSVRLGDAAGNFTGTTEVKVGELPNSVTVADVNGDGKLDILTANEDTNNVSVRLGDRTGNFTGTTEVAVGISPFSVTVADVNGDGKLDVLTANLYSDTVSVRLGDGTGRFGGGTDVKVGSNPASVTLADVNGDGKLDILAANKTTNNVSVVLNTSTTGLSFDAGSITRTTPGAATSLAIDTTAPALTGVPTALAVGREDTAYIVTKAQLLDGWTDAGSAPLTVSGLTASSGTVTDNGNGSYTVTPAADANGPVTLSYRVGDGPNAANATRTVVFNAVNDAPVALELAAALSQRMVTHGSLIPGTVFDPDGDPTAISAIAFGLTATVVTGPATVIQGTYGHLTIGTGGHYEYAADAEGGLAVGATAQDVFRYTVTDAGGATAQAALRFSVTGSPYGDDGANVFRLTGPGTFAMGLGGNDVYYVDNAADQVTEAAGGGVDTVYASADYTLGAGQEIEWLRANAGATGLRLTGNERANSLVSGAGKDTLAGGLGNDVYYVNGAADQVIEAVGGGVDTVYASVDYTLGAGQEIEWLRANAGATGLRLTGNERANNLVSGAGNDTLAGGLGNDVYYVNGAADQVIEAAGGGVDMVYASVDYTLRAGQEIERLYANAGATGLTLTGNERANSLVSGAGNDTLAGGLGNDVYYVNGAADQVIEAAGGGMDMVYASVDYTLGAGQEIERLYANAGTTGLTLTGNERANSLVSGAGNDTLAGGLGNDVYYVDNAADQVIEAAGGGVDAVYASVDYTLGVGQEIERLYANAGATGLTLIGNERANSLMSGAGHDTLAGGLGNDVYYVNGAADQVIEAAGGGVDTVYASVDYTLGAGQEIEWLRANAGTTGLTLTGNERANNLVSGAGHDTLAGGLGNDVYYVDNAADQVIEAVGGGVDTVYASVDYTLGAGQEIEWLRANAGATGLRLTGNERANNLVSGAGNDTLAGGGGTDTLTGGAGADTFVFGPADRTSTDRVSDFSSLADDRLQFKAADYGLVTGRGLNGDGTLNADYFESGLSATKAHGQFLFNTGTKTLLWDADGSGSGAGVAVVTFTVPGGVAAQDFLHASDFLFV